MNTDTMMTSTILVCTFASLVGVLIGLALAKMQANSETEEAFERGREEGKEEGVRESQERFLKEKEEIKDGLSRNLAGIRDSIVRAVEAYEETVQTVEEQFDVAPGALLGEPEQEQRLLPGSKVVQASEDSGDSEDSDELVLESDESEAVIDEVEEEISRELSSTNGASKLETRADKETDNESCSEEDAKECCGAACDSAEEKSAECDSEEKSEDAEKEEEEKKASDTALAENQNSVLHDNVKIH